MEKKKQAFFKALLAINSLSCQVALKNAPGVTRLCIFLYLSEHAILSNCHSQFVFFVSHHTSAALSISPKTNIWFNLGPLIHSDPCQWVLWYVQNTTFHCSSQSYQYIFKSFKIGSSVWPNSAYNRYTE